MYKLQWVIYPNSQLGHLAGTVSVTNNIGALCVPGALLANRKAVTLVTSPNP